MRSEELLAFLDGLDATETEKSKFRELLRQIRSDESLLEAFLDSTNKNAPEATAAKKIANAQDQHGQMDVLNTIYPSEFDTSLPDKTQRKETIIFRSADTIIPDSLPGDMVDFDLTPMPSSAEQSLGRYQDLGLLGRGGMGEVRKVRDALLNRNVAMKILYPELSQHKIAMSRFIEEAQVGAQLQHPNIVPIHELGQLPDGRYYFTMTEIRGTEFTELIHKSHQKNTEDPFDLDQDSAAFRKLIQIFHKICETIAFSHSLGVIHRDLKPENIMIGEFGEVLVVDWGLAKVMGQADHNPDLSLITGRSSKDHMKTRMGTVNGTPAYMSPEQAQGRTNLISPQSDIYSLGAILYETLSGNTPYKGRSAKDILKQVLEGNPRSLRSIADTMQPEEENSGSHLPTRLNIQGQIPSGLIKICERAMQRDPNHRYPSAKELAQDVFDWLEGAQKRDKALKKVNEALASLARAKERQEEQSQFWEDTQLLAKENSLSNRQLWMRWQKTKDLQKDGEALQGEHKRTLQDALVYDPDIEEAHTLLAQGLKTDILSAFAKGDKRLTEELTQRLQIHLKTLSNKKSTDFLEQLSRAKRDQIGLLRAKHGPLIGRKRLLFEITDAMRGDLRMASIVGTAGVGKTRLAIEAIYRLRSEKGQAVFCDLTEASSGLGFALSVAKSLDVVLDSQDPVEQLGERFASKPTILALDNLEQIASEAAGVIGRWLARSQTLKVIITSRIALHLPEERVFSIAPLNPLEAMELFSRHAKKAFPGFEIQEDSFENVFRIVSQLDRLPLAIELAAARLNIFSIAEIETRINERFSLLRSRDSTSQALQGALDWSWDLLNPWAKAALAQSSVFRGGFDIKAADAVIDCKSWAEAPPLFDVLQTLCENSLLLQNKSPEGGIRYGLLESIREYALEKLKSPTGIPKEMSGLDAMRLTARRHASYFASQVKGSMRITPRKRKQTKDISTLLLEQDNLIAATEHGTGEDAGQCCLGVLSILSMKGPVSLGANIAKQVLQDPSLPASMRKEIQLARIRFLRIGGRMEEARHDSQTDLELEKTDPKGDKQASHITDPIRRAEILLERGRIEEAECFYDKAMAFFMQAKEIFIAKNAIEGSIESAAEMATVYKQTGENKKAISTYKEALLLAEGHALPSLQSKVLSGLGNAYGSIGDLPKALDTFQQALKLNQAGENKAEEGIILGNMGPMHQELGQYPEAIDCYRRALDINREVGNRRMQALNLGNMANTYFYMGEYETSLALFRQSLAINREIGNQSQVAVNLGNMANICRNMGDFEQTLELYETAVEISRQVEDKRSEGRHLANMALINMELKNTDKALTLFFQALHINRQVEDRRAEAITLGNIGCLYAEIEKLPEAVNHLRQSVQYCDDCQFLVGSHVFRAELAKALAKDKRYDEAIAAFEGTSELFKNTPVEYGKSLCTKAEVMHMSGKSKEAEAILLEAKDIAVSLLPNKDMRLEETIKRIEGLLDSESQP